MRLEAFPEFALAVSLNVSRKLSPFIFSVFILGGAGFVEAKVRYLPLSNTLSTDVSIGLSASASLAFAFGPISGQVAVLLGTAVEYHQQPGQGGGSLDIALTLLILGRVDVLGIITVDISLLLEAKYEGNGRITASGSLSISVRVSIFFKISVSAHVSYDFKQGSGSSTNTLSAHPAYKGAKSLANAAN